MQYLMTFRWIARMRPLAVMLVLAVALSTLSAVTAESPAAAAPVAHSQIRDAAERWIAENGVPGLQVSVVRAGKSPYTIAVGEGDAHDGTPMGTADRFDLMSITKTFTAALVWQAVDRGQINPDQPIPTLTAVPDFPYAGQVTPRQLLLHQTGIVNYRDTPTYWNDPAGVDTPQAALRASGQQPLLFAPGTSTAYSSSNYLVLGFLLQQATGRSYDDLLRNEILIPFGISGVTHAQPAPGEPRFSTAGIWASTGETAVFFQKVLSENGLHLSAPSFDALAKVTSAYGYSAGLWGYCPCNGNADGTVDYYARGHSGHTAMVHNIAVDNMTIAVHLSATMWEPAVRYFNVNDFLHEVHDLELRTKVAASGTIRVHLPLANTTYLGNLTITEPEAAGYATIYPCALGQPPTSNINYAANQTIANQTITTTDNNGDLCITTSATTHIIYDHTATTTNIEPQPATRDLDTRQ